MSENALTTALQIAQQVGNGITEDHGTRWWRGRAITLAVETLRRHGIDPESEGDRADAAATPAPVSGDDRSALIATIYATPTPLGVLPASTWPFPVSVTEVADAILAAGFSRSPARDTDT